MIKLEQPDRLKEYLEQSELRKMTTCPVEDMAELVCFAKGEHICVQGQPLEYLLFLVEGKAKAYITVSSGKSLLLCFYERPEVIGDVELLSGDRTATTSLQALEEVTCIGIRISQHGAALLGDARFLQHIGTGLGEKLKRSSHNSTINLTYPLENRLAAYILSTMQEDNRFSEQLTQLADLLGTSYRHLLRTLDGLIERGILEKKGRSLLVRDQVALRSMASDIFQ